MVRGARMEDIPRIAEILVFAKRTAYLSVFRNERGSFCDLQVMTLAREYEADAECLERALVYDDGVVKGVLTRRFCGAYAELCELYVEPLLTGKGVGRALMDFFLTEAAERRCTRAGLWVIRENGRARRFYEAAGFAPLAVERCVEGTNVPEMRYEKRL